ncbi:PREDICTED: rab3 GTPase-activating protein catalytic subunit-like [Nicrophorus vespilloides]|uniref:Rab3 GTPase-activating protein catalytic subunit-like n=1 Tax=Nicrophorus vespilloides TaxID=110193 RepID=A0ABM1MSU2_NICVS|nr:PREDICTED: rab3 GTPase-activating protein catalytic subunit-like [Nicrophorus vespilloides]
MNEEIDESEFYHQDFTTASKWELFIARIEEIIHDWKSTSTKDGRKLLRLGSFESQCEILPFADVDFSLTYYKKDGVCEDEQKPKNPIENGFDFELDEGVNSHGDYCLSLWYGLEEYIVLSPLNSNSLVSESEIKILLSSLNAVVGNVNCDLPLFVQIREKWQRCYLGVFEGNGTRTNFEMVHLRKGPQHCQYLTGLVDLFKTKLMSPLPLDPIIVSVQTTYQLTDFGNYVWRQDITDNEIENCTNSILMLPLGVTVDPIASINLKATWNDVPEMMIVDSENYSNFDPTQAEKWSVSVDITDQPICLLSDCLTDFLHVLGNASTIYDCLGDYAQPPETSNPLDLLTEPKVPTISSVLKRAARNSSRKTRKGVAPLSEEVLVPMLYFLFPDAEEDSHNVYSDPLKKDEGNNEYDVASKYEDMFKGFKTCRMDSLVWRLSIVLSQALHSLGANRAFAHIWFEFVQEMRYRWEKSIMIPG